MVKYLAYFRVCLKNMYAYRLDFLLYMGINTVFFYVSVALWVAVYKSSGVGEINSYTLANTITYYLLTGLIFRLDLINSMYLAEEIWNGQFTNDLIKPWSPIFSNFIAAMGDLAIGIVTYLPFFIIMALTSFRYINLPSLSNFLLFLLILGLSLIMNFCFNLILHALTLHFGDQASQIELVNYVTAFLAGAYVPIAFLTGWFRQVFMSLPFRYQFFFPIEVFLGKVNDAEVIRGVIEVVVWTLIFYGLFMIIYKSGLKKYTGTGR